MMHIYLISTNPRVLMNLLISSKVYGQESVDSEGNDTESIKREPDIFTDLHNLINVKNKIKNRMMTKIIKFI